MNTHDRALLILALSWALAEAASAHSAQSPPLAIGAAPIAHVSGGVGEMDRARMQAMKDQYNLHLIFAVAKSGPYLADVPVSITDATAKKVLETVSQDRCCTQICHRARTR